MQTEIFEHARCLACRLRLRPRMLRGVEKRDQSVTLLGQRLSMPVGISPTAFQRLANPIGEEGTAMGELTYSSSPTGESVVYGTLSWSRGPEYQDELKANNNNIIVYFLHLK